jgi:hypothetical protein
VRRVPADGSDGGIDGTLRHAVAARRVPVRPRRYRGIPVGAAALSRAEQTHTHPLPAAPSSVRPLVRNGRKPPPGHESPAQPSAAGSAPRVPLEHGQHAGRNPTYTLGGIPLTVHVQAPRRRCARLRLDADGAPTHMRARPHTSHTSHTETHAYAHVRTHTRTPTHTHTCIRVPIWRTFVLISLCVCVCV